AGRREAATTPSAAQPPLLEKEGRSDAPLRLEEGSHSEAGGEVEPVTGHWSPVTDQESPITDHGSLLEIRDLKVHFPVHKGVLRRVVAHVKAVDGVSLSIAAGRTLGLVGESGCGKTTVGKSIVRLLDPTSGEILFDGADLAKLRRGALRPHRKHVQIIFQDPYSSLNPRIRIAETLEEGMAALGV